MDFVGGSPSRRDAVAAAVEYASVENMRKLEERNTFWLAGGRMKPGKKGDPNSYKVRRAKVGGYRDYFDDAQAAEIDELVRKRLAPAFGYDTAPQSPFPRGVGQGKRWLGGIAHHASSPSDPQPAASRRILA
jgi:hypothetical protein